MRRAAGVTIGLATMLAASLLIALPATADVSSADVDLARERLRQVNERLQDEVGRYDQAVAEEALLHDRLDGLVVDLTARERELTLARAAARARAAEMYMTAGAATPSIHATDDVASLPAKLVYLEAVSQTDRDLVNRLEVSRRDYEQQRALVDEALAQQEGLRAEMEGLVTHIYDELDAANADYQAVKAQWDAQEAERVRREEFLATSTTTTVVLRASTTTGPPPTTTAGTTTTTAAPTTTVGATATTATAGATTTSEGDSTTTTEETTTTAGPPATTTTVPPAPVGTMTCPVDGATTFTDTWGAARPGGRVHHGTDLLASEGTPLVAIEGGYIWSPNWDADGGLGLYIKGDDGDLWYYAHLSSYVADLHDGQRVEVGQRVGYVGQTGNATVPHLHLGWYPGGYGNPIANPYPVALQLCG
jgi:murein DD-endopeptidase MepM/ murein hydrolase activator NlpD